MCGSTLSAMGSPTVAARPSGQALAGRFARWSARAAGRAMAVAARSVTSLPGAAGALALAYGVGQIYRPLFWITVGLAGLLVDRRMT